VPTASRVVNLDEERREMELPYAALWGYYALPAQSFAVAGQDGDVSPFELRGPVNVVRPFHAASAPIAVGTLV
jgi:hypothetical protein